MNTVLDLEYYNKFPDALKNALIDKKISFPKSLQQTYDEMCVYRGVSYNSNKKYIDKNDFISYVEKRKFCPLIVVDENDISSYSCSCFLDINKMIIITKFPTKNKAIAKGIIKSEFGPIDVNNETSHVDLYLFDNIDISKEFEVIKKWEKNG